MSTPISRNSKLQGPELYAPRGTVHRPVAQNDAGLENWILSADDQVASGRPSLSSAALGHSTDDRPETTQNKSGRSESEAAAIEEWLAQVIREALKRRQTGEGLSVAAPQGKAELPLAVAPAADVSADRKLLLPTPERSARRGAKPPVPNRTVLPHLESEIVPEPPARTGRKTVFRPVVRLALVMIFAGVAAYGVTTFSSLQMRLKGTKNHRANVSQQLQQVRSTVQSISRLIVKDQQASTNEPLLLAVHIDHARSDESLLLHGLAQGSTLSAGTPVSPSSWKLPLSALREVYLYAPTGFVGVMNAEVDLLGSSENVLDSRVVQLKWIAKQPKTILPVATAVAATTTAARVGPVPLAAALPMTTPVVPAVVPINPEEALMLMQQGRDSMSAGDISAARVVFRRLADAGNPDAALALATTYDPDYLTAHNFLGVQGDDATARALYLQAKRLGSREAGQILARMAGK